MNAQTKISGAMFTMQRGAGRHAEHGRCVSTGLDLNADAFEEVRTAVTRDQSATLTATGQLPKFADDAYSHRA